MRVRALLSVALALLPIAACRPSRTEVRKGVFAAIDSCARRAGPVPTLAVVAVYEPKDGGVHLQHFSPTGEPIAPFRACIDESLAKLHWPAGGADVDVVYVGPLPRQ